MPKFSKSSLKKLGECHPNIQSIFNEVIKHYDCKVLCGYRSEEDQTRAFDGGYSKVQYPNSKHNIVPSHGIDVVPYPIDWSDRESFYHFAGYVKGVADMHNVNIRWGGDWDGDLDLHDQTFFDLGHFELVT
jgi:hypothetical protein